MSDNLSEGSDNTGQKWSVFSCLLRTFRLTLIIIHNLYHIPAYLLITWIVLLPLYRFNRPLYWIIENHLYNWCLYTVASWSWTNRVTRKCTIKLSTQLDYDKQLFVMVGCQVHLSICFAVIECGDDYTKIQLKRENGNNNYLKQEAKETPKLLLVCNHQSTADVPLMMRAFVSHSKHKLLWVMEDVFKYTNFGIVSVTHGDYFLKAKEYTKQDLTKYCLSPESKCKDLIILFPEGGFRYKRLESSHRYASSRNKQQLLNVTWPRHGAFDDLNVDQLQFTHLIDLTIIYPDINSPPSILDICCGQHPNLNVYFYYRVYDRNCTLDGNWLDRVFQEKEAIIDQFYLNKNQLFEDKSKFMRPVGLSWFKLIAIHVFYIIATCIFIVIFNRIFIFSMNLF